MSPGAFDPLRILATLRQHSVRFVLIGGIAARLWGSPTVTGDLDLCYARDPENLTRLALALRELRARLRGVAEDVPFLLDARTLAAGDTFPFATDAGALDVFGFPAGSGGYEALARTAERMEIADEPVLVAALTDLIRMKETAGRAKDRIEVEVLSALREEIEKRDRGER